MASEEVGTFKASVTFREGHYTGWVTSKVGDRTTVRRGLALRADHEQQDLYNYLAEELAWWIEVVATTVLADRQARIDAQA